jgi:putative copper export protein
MEAFDVASVAVRALAFILSLQSAGLILFRLTSCRGSPDAVRTVDSLAGVSAFVAVPFVLAHRALDAPRLAGEWSGILDSQLERVAWSHSPGSATIVCVIGLLAICAGTSVGRRSVRYAAPAGVLCVVASFALTGHTTDAAAPAIARLLLVCHVGVAGYWIGSVAGLLRLSFVAAQSGVAASARRFSADAVWLVPLLLPLGVGMLAGIVHEFSALRSPYGAFLLGKALGFSVVLSLAAHNRLRTLPALARGDRRAIYRFRHTLIAEYAVLGIVLATTATMSALYSPH